MFTSGSAAPSAALGDVHIAHSLAGRVKMYVCAMPVGTRTGRKEAEGREGAAAKEEQVQCQFKGLIGKETRSSGRRGTGRRNVRNGRAERRGSFQPSTHQSAWLLRCLVGVESRRTDCSQ